MNKFSLNVLCGAVTLLTAAGVLLVHFGLYRPSSSDGGSDDICIDSSDTTGHLTLIFTGDLMQHGPQVQSAMQRDGTIDYTACFSRLKSYFSSADYVIANLETTLGDPPYTGYPQFRAPMELASAMRRAGINIAVVANNHICDRGGKGIRKTLEALDRAGIPSIGAYADTASAVTRRPLWITKHGFRIALFNCTYGTNGLPVPSGCTVNRIDTTRIGKDITAARTNGATHIIVFIHWGLEYQTTANLTQRTTAAALHRAGCDLVIGSHPHVVQSIETVRDTSGAISGINVFSLGNFFSNQSFPGTDGGISVRLRLAMKEGHSLIAPPEYLIHWVAVSPDTKSRSGHRYEVIPSYSSQSLPKGVRPGFDRFISRTRAYLERTSPDAREITSDFELTNTVAKK